VRRRFRSLAASLEGSDPYLLGGVALLLFIGTFVVWGAGSYSRHASGSLLGQHYILAKHVFMIGVGLTMLVALSRLDQRLLRLRWPLRAAHVVSLLLVAWTLKDGCGLITGDINRWVTILGFNFQPVEPAKLVCILFVAERLTIPSDGRQPALRNILEALGFGVIPLLILLVLQPNFGNVMVIVGVAVVMLFIARVRAVHMLRIVVVPAVGMALAFAVVPKLRLRLGDWLHGLLERDDQYQVRQPLVGMGAGGWRGLGPGQSHNKFAFLPESHTDFAFSVLGEEWGLFGTVLVISTLVLVAWRGYGIAARAADPFGRVAAAGLTSAIVIYGVANIGMVTGALPVIGVKLPFVRFGGTAMVGSLASVGLLLNFERASRVQEVTRRRWERTGWKR